MARNGQTLSPGSASPVLARGGNRHADNPLNPACGRQAGAADDWPRRVLGPPPARLRNARHHERRKELGCHVPGRRQDGHGDDRQLREDPEG